MTFGSDAFGSSAYADHIEVKAAVPDATYVSIACDRPVTLGIVQGIPPYDRVTVQTVITPSVDATYDTLFPSETLYPSIHLYPLGPYSVIRRYYVHNS